MLPTIFRPRSRASSIFPITRDFDQTFDDLFNWWPENGETPGAETAAYPVDIREDNGQILVDAEMPGFDKDEVEVTLENGVLNICAEHQEEKEQKKKGKPYLSERRYRRIQRSFTLPAAADASKVKANLKDGVLHLAIPKAQEATASKIAVK